MVQSAPDGRPNILIIQCDQLSQQAVGAYGNPHARTPNMDALAARGMRFEKVYSPCPLCRPARAATWTSRWPHETGVVGNGSYGDAIPGDMPTLGELLSEAGYEAVHFGKTHDAGALRGFDVRPQGKGQFDTDPGIHVNADSLQDRFTVPQAIEYLSTPPDRPRLTVVDLQNPHNICGWIGENIGPQDAATDAALPPLPENFEIEDLHLRPLPIQYLCCSHRRLAQGARWSENDYRRYLAAYYRYCELADADVGRLLDALYASPTGENTLVILTSDHGEGMARHRMITKQLSFYEETARVPLIVAGPGVAGQGRRSEDGPLVTLLDLLPTLCQIAGAPTPDVMRGRSLAAWLSDEARGDEGHEYVIAQWVTEYGFTVSPGRMLRTGRYKYTRYLEGDGEELYDLQEDPGERRTLVDDPAAADVLEDHRRLLRRYVEATGDPFFGLEVKVDLRWRSHRVGYMHHEGTNALDHGREQAKQAAQGKTTGS